MMPGYSIVEACDAMRLPDGSYRCLTCATSWEADDDKPPCTPWGTARDTPRPNPAKPKRRG